MKNSGGRFQNLDLLQRRPASCLSVTTGLLDGKRSFHLRWTIPKINPKVHLLLLPRGMGLSNWCVFVLLFSTRERAESLEKTLFHVIYV